MKSIRFFLLGLLFLTVSCQKPAHENINDLGDIWENADDMTLSAITDPSDPNLSDQWNWYESSTTHADIYVSQGNGPIESRSISLPWNTMGNPTAVADSDKDFYPEDGWRLYFRDFGTPNRAAQTPFFALYNKYRGILRFFIYNYKETNPWNEQTPTYFVATLSFKNQARSNSMLNFTSDPEYSTHETYRSDEKQTVIVPKNAEKTWLNLDFSIANFEGTPEGPEHLLDLVVYAVDESEINLSSDFSDITAQISVGANSNGGNSFATTINRGHEFAKTSADFIKALENVFDSNPSANVQNMDNARASDSIPETIIAPQGASTIIAAVAAGLGVIKAFFGGKKAHIPDQMIKYDGMVSTNGTSNFQRSRYFITWSPRPNSPLNPSYYTPIYTERTGIWQIYHPPVLSFLWSGSIYYVRESPCFLRYYLDVSRISDWINPDILDELELVEKRVKVIHDYHDSEYPWESEWTEVTGSYASFGWIQAYLNTARYLLTDRGARFSGLVGLEYTFKIKDYTGKFDDEIVFSKVYRANTNFSPHQTGNCPNMF
ncbi:hypothetical protein ACFOET_11085 [Parapedobacter deserti]|uniref:Uncharacterized protein n=1 Tax=Parapedobacter deserti TaxID=1912957 RepID=A0ABV7JJC2_9SPHI